MSTYEELSAIVSQTYHAVAAAHRGSCPEPTAISLLYFTKKPIFDRYAVPSGIARARPSTKGALTDAAGFDLVGSAAVATQEFYRHNLSVLDNRGVV